MKIFSKRTIRKILAVSHPEKEENFDTVWMLAMNNNDYKERLWYWEKMQELDLIHETKYTIPSETKPMKWLYKVSPKGNIVKNKIHEYELLNLIATIVSVLFAIFIGIKGVLDDKKLDKIELELKDRVKYEELLQKDIQNLKTQIQNLTKSDTTKK